MSPDLVLLAVTLLLSTLLTYVLRARLIAKAQFDTPNERSMHKIPVPRGGGLAVISIIIVGFVVAAFNTGEILRYLGALTGLVLVIFVSWLDDKKGAGVLLRFGTQILASALAVSSLDGLVFAGYLPTWLDHTIVVIGLAWFMNLYNFMDGIDGISGVETVCLALGLFLFSQDILTSTLMIVVAGSALGFLVWNWHPAKIFMGDVGSVSLGLLLGFFLLQLAAHGHPAAALILPLYYLADSGLTITRRALRREKIWQAHREHFYQKAAVPDNAHDRVTLWIAGANILLLGASFVEKSDPFIALALAIGIVAILLIKLHNRAKSIQKS